MQIIKKMKYNIQIKIIGFLSKTGIYKGFPIHYIGGSEALPPPLTSDEESYLLTKLKDSDFGVKTILIERNLRLVVYIARKFENTGIGVKDQNYLLLLLIQCTQPGKDHQHVLLCY
jgi:RNA polymerase sporulation-specific sigma factor